MPPSLGPAFWGNFFLLDDTHSETDLQSHLQLLQLHLEPSDSIAIDVVQRNCRIANESLRGIGFLVPSAAGKRVICMWCWKSRACNSSSLQAHLVTCALCPEAVKSRYRKAATEGKSAVYYFGAHQLASAQTAQQQVEASSPEAERAARPHESGEGSSSLGGAVVAVSPPSPITALSSSRKRPAEPAAALVPATLFPSAAFDTTPLAVAHDVQSDAAVADASATDAPAAHAALPMDDPPRLACSRDSRMAWQQRIRVIGAADADSEALEDPNCWRQWSAICERQAVDSLS